MPDLEFEAEDYTNIWWDLNILWDGVGVNGNDQSFKGSAPERVSFHLI